MPLHIKQNIPEDVVAILKVVKRYRHEASSMHTFNHHAALEDLECHLCDLLSSIISAPLNGRLFLLPPSAYVTPEQKQQSIQTNLLPT